MRISNLLKHFNPIIIIHLLVFAIAFGATWRYMIFPPDISPVSNRMSLLGMAILTDLLAVIWIAWTLVIYGPLVAERQKEDT